MNSEETFERHPSNCLENDQAVSQGFAHCSAGESHSTPPELFSMVAPGMDDRSNIDMILSTVVHWYQESRLLPASFFFHLSACIPPTTLNPLDHTR